MCSFRTPFFMRGIHTSNIINSIKFPSAPFHQNLQAIFAKHRMTTRHQHHIAWLGQTNDTEALLFRQKWTPSWWEIFADLGFLGLDLTKVTKKGGWFFTNSTSILTKIIQNIQNLLIHFKWKIPILILHPILHTPPSKKKIKKLVLIPMLYLITWVTRTATQPLGSSPSTVKVSFQVSRLPLHREKHRPHYLQVGKPSLRLQSQYPVNKTRQPPQHFYQTQVILRENFFEYHLVTLLEGCSHSLDSKCSKHVTYYSKTWYLSTHTILRHPSSERLSTQTITGVPLVSQASSCCPRHLIRLPTHLGI